MRIKHLWPALVAIAALASTGTSTGQVSVGSITDSGGISVSGTGEVRARPNSVELKLRASGTAELTADAIVKYKDSKERLLAAFEELKLPDMKVVEGDVSIVRGDAAALMNYAMRGQTPAGKQTVEIASSLWFMLGGIGEMEPPELMELLGRILDVARDAGAAVGPTAAEVNYAYRYGRPLQGSLVDFVITDFASHREEAYEKAIADARQRAERLASLTGVTLGPVMAVQEVLVTGDPEMPQRQTYGMAAQEKQPLGPRIVSETFGDVAIFVKLNVRFAIAHADATAAN